jgi:hypothetical protein
MPPSSRSNSAVRARGVRPITSLHTLGFLCDCVAFGTEEFVDLLQQGALQHVERIVHRIGCGEEVGAGTDRFGCG